MEQPSTQSMTQKIESLRKPLPTRFISWRVGKTRAATGATNNKQAVGQALPYIKPRVIQDMLDDLIGAENWRNRFVPVQMGTYTSLMCEIDIYIDGRWVTKSDGAQLDSFGDKGSDREIAIKGLYSDAFKRAAVMWGIGRYLYDFQVPWVPLKGEELAYTPLLPLDMVPEAEHAAYQATSNTNSSQAAGADTPATATTTEEKTSPANTVDAKAEVTKTDDAKSEPAVPSEPASDSTTEAANVAEEQARASAIVDAAVQAEDTANAAVAAAESTTAVNVAPAEGATNADAAVEGLTEAGILAELPPEKAKLAAGLIEKILKPLPTSMLRGYITGPKCSWLVGNPRAYIMDLLVKAELAEKQAKEARHAGN